MPAAGAVEKLLIDRFAPPSLVVNERYEVVHFPNSRTSRYLEAPIGEPTRDLLKMARPELRSVLRAATHKAFNESQAVVFKGVKLAGETAKTDIQVEPFPGRLVLVQFVPPLPPARPVLPRETEPANELSSRQRVKQLEEQLQITPKQLQATIEQLETSNEELLSINEEFQSTNEELHSTNEELETSREKLQALNEELVTVNAELQLKVEEVNRANSDLDNLLTASEIATLFLDRQLAIKLFSPAMAGIFNLIPADIGRPFSNLAGGFNLSDLACDAKQVLETLAAVEGEVVSLDGAKVYLKRVLPYRTTAGTIDGVVVTFIDITERKRAEEALKEREEIYRAIVSNAAEGFVLTDPETLAHGRIQRCPCSGLGYSREEFAALTLPGLPSLPRWPKMSPRRVRSLGTRVSTCAPSISTGTKTATCGRSRSATSTSRSGEGSGLRSGMTSPTRGGPKPNWKKPGGSKRWGFWTAASPTISKTSSPRWSATSPWPG